MMAEAESQQHFAECTDIIDELQDYAIQTS